MTEEQKKIWRRYMELRNNMKSAQEDLHTIEIDTAIRLQIEYFDSMDLSEWEFKVDSDNGGLFLVGSSSFKDQLLGEFFQPFGITYPVFKGTHLEVSVSADEPFGFWPVTSLKEAIAHHNIKVNSHSIDTSISQLRKDLVMLLSLKNQVT